MMIQNNLAFTEDQAIPEGYKKTDQGLLPQSWNIVAIRTLVSRLDAGISVNSVDSLDAYSHGKHVLKTSCVAKGYFLPNEKKSILPIDINRAKTIPEKGSIIVSRMNTPELVGELGYVHVFDENIYLPDRLWQMIFKKDQQLCSRWLAYLLSSKKFSKQIKESATGTSNSMKNISKEVLLSLEIPYPKFDEQEKIATALSDTDALISELEKLIEKKQAIKTATMQQLLTGKTRLPEFALREDGTPNAYKDSELGQIPEDWEIYPLKSLLKSQPKYGINAAATTLSGNLPTYIRITDIDEDGKFNPTEKVGVNSTLSGNYILERGDIVLARTGASVGKSYLYNEYDGELVYAGFLIKISPAPNLLCSKYLSIYFQTKAYWDWIATNSMRSGQPGINGNQYANLKIVLPSINEQLKISRIFTDIDRDLEQLKIKLHKVMLLKQGIMQELLTGKTRLV